jgi:hypothetical protein
MTRSIPLSLSALVLLAGLAVAAPDDEGFDLRARYVTRKGDATRIVEIEKKAQKFRIVAPDGSEIQSVDQTTGQELRYDEEIHELDAEGKEAVSATRRYSGITDFMSGDKVDLSAKPFVVKITRSADHQVRHEPADPAVEVPPLVQQAMDSESGVVGPSTEDDFMKLMFPEGKVKVGGTWTVPLEDVAAVFDMGDPPEEPAMQDGPMAPPPAPGTSGAPPAKAPAIDAAKSSCTGTLEGVEVEDGVKLLRIKVVVKLVMNRFGGSPTRGPLTFDGVMSFRLSEGATSPCGGATMHMSVKGTILPEGDESLPPGSSVELDITHDMAKTVTKVPAK